VYLARGLIWQNAARRNYTSVHILARVAHKYKNSYKTFIFGTMHVMYLIIMEMVESFYLSHLVKNRLGGFGWIGGQN